MRYFKDAKGNVFAYESDGSQDKLIQADMLEISFEEMKDLQRTKMESEIEMLSYSDKRRREYPEITSYLDAIVKNDQAQMDAYVKACRAVKQKYPKP
ncbi:hypothetical protein [Curvivirga sp.]|uniref:hypothetical protein n=1 Tax=Curvivirga sp. TaxID=2856848 RepID=UPI003B5BE8B3